MICFDRRQCFSATSKLWTCLFLRRCHNSHMCMREEVFAGGGRGIMGLARYLSWQEVKCCCMPTNHLKGCTFLDQSKRKKQDKWRNKLSEVATDRRANNQMRYHNEFPVQLEIEASTQLNHDWLPLLRPSGSQRFIPITPTLRPPPLYVPASGKWAIPPLMWLSVAAAAVGNEPWGNKIEHIESCSVQLCCL